MTIKNKHGRKFEHRGEMTSGRTERSTMTRRGRPAGFDGAEALQRAMQLFWARCYVGVTLEDLQRSACRRYRRFGKPKRRAKGFINREAIPRQSTASSAITAAVSTGLCRETRREGR